MLFIHLRHVRYYICRCSPVLGAGSHTLGYPLLIYLHSYQTKSRKHLNYMGRIQMLLGLILHLYE